MSVNPSTWKVKKEDSLVSLDNQDVSGWANATNNFGFEDPIQATDLYRQNRLGFEQLRALHETDPLARRFVDLRSSDMTRKSFTFVDQGNSDGAEDLENAIKKEYNINQKIFSLDQQSKIFGGAVFYLDIEDGGRPEDPLNENNIRKIKSITVHNSFRCQEYGVDSYYPIGHEKAGEPVHYRLNYYLGNDNVQIIVHESRIIPLLGTTNIDYTSRRNYWGFSPSIYQHLYNVIRRYGVATQAGPSIIQNFVEEVMYLEGLPKITKRTERIQFLRTQRRERNLNNTTLMGATDKVEKLATPVTGLDGLYEQIQTDVAMSGNYPVGILFSKSEGSGLGGGGHLSEERITYYDSVSSEQENRIVPVVDRVKYLKGLEMGIDTEDMTTVFNPLHEMSELDMADLRLKHTQADDFMINQGFPATDIWESTYGGDQYNFDQVKYSKKSFEAWREEQDELMHQNLEKTTEITNQDDPKEKEESSE